MPKAADIGSKCLISLSPDVWVKWVTEKPDHEVGYGCFTRIALVSRDFEQRAR